MGTSRAVKELNRTLEDIRATIRQHHYELERYEAIVKIFTNLDPKNDVSILSKAVT